MEDVEILRNSNVDILASLHENVEVFDGGPVSTDEMPPPLHQAMLKHNLTIIMEGFVKHYVAYDEIALDKLRSGVYALDYKTMQTTEVAMMKNITIKQGIPMARLATDVQN